MRACVVFDSRFGNTEKIAKAIEAGIETTGIRTDCLNSKEVKSLSEYDLVCVGAPTEAFTASKPMKDFLRKLKTADLRGKYGFAFDTKLDSRFSGSAAKTIENHLRELGMMTLVPRESAIVFTTKDQGVTNTLLKDGEEQRFVDLGKRLGAALAPRPSVSAAAGRLDVV